MDSKYFDVVVVGAGHAGTQLVTNLLQVGFAGSIGVLDASVQEPYERPPLSKAYLKGEVADSDLAFRAKGFWTNEQLELMLGEAVTMVDPARRLLRTQEGRELGFGRLVWAAGGTPRALPVPGNDLAGVYHLATLEDAGRLRAALAQSQRLVVVGGGFIGLEVSSAAALAGVEVTVLEREDRLLARVTGPDVSDYFCALHVAAGVDIRLGAEVAELISSGSERVSAVRLTTGEVLEADTVLVAVGSGPNVAPLVDAGARHGDGIEVDDACVTSLDGIYAIGDVARFPLDGGARTARLESINNAVEQAKVTATHILTNGTEGHYAPTPWFWSFQYDTKFRSVGLVDPQAARIVRGDRQSGSFSVVYLRGTTVVAVDCVNNMKDFVAAMKVVGRQVDPSSLGDQGTSLADAVVPGSH